MRILGVYLLYAAVALRGIVAFTGSPRLPLIVALFTAYGALLVLERWFTRRQPPGSNPSTEPEASFEQKSKTVLYVAMLTVLVVGLMAVPETQDFFALLFVPPSMQAVLIFGRRAGFTCIMVFSLMTCVALLGSEDGPLFGLAMGVFFSGMLFLFGAYAFQVQQAETARIQNQRILEDLQAAHRSLQEYTHQKAALSVEQERSRLARDLHDSVTQTAFSMSLASQSAGLLYSNEPPRAVEQLLRLEKLAENALGEIQTLVTQLRPRSLTEEGLQAALQRMVAERETAEGVHVSLQVDGERSLTEAQILGLYSIANEALTNVMKHSGVHEAVIRLNLCPDGTFLEIEDEGAGFDPAFAMNQPGHLGMPGMYEQAREIGWNLIVESQPGHGTRIRVMEI
jgi:signal transduction histidine kinase